MDEKNDLVTLVSAYRNGMAHFRQGDGDFIRRPDGSICPAQEEIAPFRSYANLCGRNPLAECERAFTDRKVLESYLTAITDFDKMMSLAIVAGDAKVQELEREHLTKAVLILQDRIKREHVAVLGSIPAFGNVRGYLEMAPQEIYDTLSSLQMQEEADE